MTFENIEKTIREKLSYAPQLGAKIKLDFGDDGLILIDGTQNPAVMSNDDDDADTTFLCSLDLFTKIADGTQDPTMAFMTGKLKIQGSMGYAMKISALLGD
ncbi:MAG: SCP-2 sterol transfer family protein [Alphaproteobacteria bacterium]|nr:MAG: SCP-2 sterol transfer family protein [Alphaproteobacteria bacterium]